MNVGDVLTVAAMSVARPFDRTAFYNYVDQSSAAYYFGTLGIPTVNIQIRIINNVGICYLSRYENGGWSVKWGGFYDSNADTSFACYPGYWRLTVDNCSGTSASMRVYCADINGGGLLRRAGYKIVTIGNPVGDTVQPGVLITASRVNNGQVGTY